MWYSSTLNNSNTENVYCTQVYAKLIQFNFLESLTAGNNKIMIYSIYQAVIRFDNDLVKETIDYSIYRDSKIHQYIL